MSAPEYTPGQNVESERAAVEAMSDADLEAMVATQRAARAQAEQAEAAAKPQEDAAAVALRKKIEEQFADISDDTTKRLDASDQRNATRMP